MKVVHDILQQVRDERVRRIAEFLRLNPGRYTARQLSKHLGIKVQNVVRATKQKTSLMQYQISSNTIKNKNYFWIETASPEDDEKNAWAKIILAVWDAFYMAVPPSGGSVDYKEIAKDAGVSTDEAKRALRVLRGCRMLKFDAINASHLPSPSQKRINAVLFLLQENRPVTAEELAEGTGDPLSTTNAYYLYGKGVISSFSIPVPGGETKRHYAWSHFDWSDYLPAGMQSVPSSTVLHQMLDVIFEGSIKEYAAIAANIIEIYDKEEA